MNFSVLTVSKRCGWETIAEESINRQTVQPAKWIVVSEGQDLSFDDHPFVYHAPKTDNPSNLNASLNVGLRAVTTDYVIFYQDFIQLQDDCFEKLMQYALPTTMVTTCTKNATGQEDMRYLGVDQIRPCRPEEWETNVALAPMKLLRSLGGFEEKLDKHGWSWDNVHLAQRAEMLRATFLLDESNRPQLLEHEQTSKLSMPTNGEYCEQLMREIRAGNSPLKLPYL